MTIGDIVLINGSIIRKILGMNKTSIIVFDDLDAKTLIMYLRKEAKPITAQEAFKILTQ